MIDQIGVDLTDGSATIVDLNETAGTLTFNAEDGSHLATYTLATFASVTGPLALRFGEGVTLPADSVLEVKMWARIY